MDPTTEPLSSKESLSQEAIPSKEKAKLQKINAKIAVIEKKLLSCSGSIETIRSTPPRERQLAVDKARRLHEVPPEAVITEDATVKFLSETVEKAQKELHQLQSKKAALELPSTKKPQKPFGLSDKEIVDLSGPLGKQYSKLVEERNTVEVILQRLYFETQAGPTRRTLGKPGDITVVLRSLDGSSRDLMFVNFYKNIKAFYDHLPDEDKLKNGPLFVTLFERLEKARPLFLLLDNLEPLKMAQNTVKQIHTLKSGESIILPGGAENHAILYEVKKQSDGTCSFTVFNSGSGIRRHHETAGKRYSNVRIGTIDPTKLNELFFKDLYSCLSIDHIYSHLQSLGTLEYDKAVHYDQGVIGSCSYECLLRWLKDQMGKELYHELRSFTVQALLDDCALHFGGQVRDDASVRKISVMSGQIPEADISKLRKYGERCIQKIGRNIQLDKAIETSTAIPDKALQTQYLLSFVEKKEIQETILDDVDRCLVLLKISNTLTSRGSAFFETATSIRDQAIKEAGAIREPEKRAALFHEIALSLFIPKSDSTALEFIKRARDEAKRISDPEKRLGACSEIADSFFIVGNNLDAMELIREAMAAAKELSDPEQRTVALLKLGKIILKNAEQLFAKGNKSEACELIDQVATATKLYFSDATLKKMAVGELVKTLVYEKEFSKIKEILSSFQGSKEHDSLVRDALDLMSNKAKEFLDKGNTSEYEHLMDQALDIGLHSVIESDKNSILKNLVSICVSQGQISRAKDLIKRMTAQYQPEGYVFLAVDLADQADALFQQGDTSKADQLMKEAIEIAKTRLPDTYDLKSHILSILSTSLIDQQKYDEAAEVIELKQVPESKAEIHLSTAQNLFSEEKETEAQRFLILAGEAAQKISDPLTKSMLFHRIADLHFSHGGKKAAIGILNQTVEFAKTITDIESRSSTLQLCSEKFLSEGSIDEARKAAELIPNEDIKKLLLQQITEK